MPESYKSLTESSEEDVGNDIEYVRYAVEIERTIHNYMGKLQDVAIHKKLHCLLWRQYLSFMMPIGVELFILIWMLVYGLRYGGMTQRTDRWHRILVKNMNYQIIAVDG